MLEQEKSNLDRLIHHAEDYFKTQQELSKLVLADKSSTMAASVLSSVILLLFFFFCFSFASVALAFYIAAVLASNWAGFAVVAGIYLVLLLLLYVNRNNWLIRPFTNAFIHNIFKSNHHE